jgi:hypothetical protein
MSEAKRSEKEMTSAAAGAMAAVRAAAGVSDARKIADLRKTIHSTLALDKGLTAAILQAQKDMAARTAAMTSAAAGAMAAVRAAAGVSDARKIADLRKTIHSTLALDKGLTAAILQAQKDMATAVEFEKRILASAERARGLTALGATPADLEAAAASTRDVRQLALQSLKGLLLVLKKKGNLILAIIEVLVLIAKIHSCEVTTKLIESQSALRQLDSELIQSQSALARELHDLSEQMRTLPGRLASPEPSHRSQRRDHNRRHARKTGSRRKHRIRPRT